MLEQIVDFSDRRIISMPGEITSNPAKTEIVQQTQMRPHRRASALLDHKHHRYQQRNTNSLHEAEQKALASIRALPLRLLTGSDDVGGVSVCIAGRRWINGHRWPTQSHRRLTRCMDFAIFLQLT
jgi:hypothetical protein